jgi:acyl carrier protein
MSSMPTTTTQLREFVTANFYVPSAVVIDDIPSFLDHGILDSTGVLELVTFIEGKFGISVPDHELVPSNFDSLAALSAYVERKRV